MHSVCISFEILLIYFFNLYKKKNHYTLQGPLSFSSSRSFIFHRYQGKFLFYSLKQ